MATFAIPVDSYGTFYSVASAVCGLRLKAVSVAQVCRSFRLQLIGGEMGVVNGQPAPSTSIPVAKGTTHSCMVVPDGSTEEMADSLDGLDNPARGKELLRVLKLKNVEARRTQTTQLTFVSRWLMALSLAKSLTVYKSIWDIRLDTGVSAVYKVAFDVLKLGKPKRAGTRGKALAFKKMLARAVAVSSHCDPDAAENSVADAEKVVGPSRVSVLTVAYGMVKAIKLASDSFSAAQRSSMRSMIYASSLDDIAEHASFSKCKEDIMADCKEIQGVKLFGIGRWILFISPGRNVILLGEEDGTKLFKLMRMGYHVLRALAADATSPSEAGFMDPAATLRTGVDMLHDLLEYGASDSAEVLLWKQPSF